MAGFMPAIYVFAISRKPWMAGTWPGHDGGLAWSSRQITVNSTEQTGFLPQA
jgi:hypothetical protein